MKTGLDFQHLRRFPSIVALIAAFLATELAFGGEPRITGSINSNASSRIVVLKTDEPHLFYIVPDRWSIHDNQVYLEESAAGDGFSLTFILGPMYAESKPAVAILKKQDPRAMFLAAPKKFTTAQLVVPSELGDTVSSLTPVNDFSSGEFFYYRVALTADQVNYLRVITKRKIELSGILTYQFPYEGQPLETTAEIHVDLVPQNLRI